MLGLGVGWVGVGVLCFFLRSAAWLLLPLSGVAIGLLVFDFYDLRQKLGKIRVWREMPGSARRDSPFFVILGIESFGTRYARGSVRDLLPNEAHPSLWLERGYFPPAGKVLFKYEVRIPIRGRHRFGPVWLRLQGRFGMLEGQCSYDVCREIKVLPDIIVSGEKLGTEALSEKVLVNKASKNRLRGEGMEFESVSEYRTGDDPRRIDWRTSARRHRLMVRRYQVEQHRDLMILLDCGRLMGTDAGCGTKLDRAVDAALMLSRVVLKGGDRCGLGIFDDRVLGYLPPLSGHGALRAISESLLNVESRWYESNFNVMFAAIHARQQKRSLVIVLSDLVDPDTSERFRTSLASLGRRHVVVFAALRTPFLRETLTTPVDSMRDVHRKAVVMRLLREREKALHLLNRVGVRVLDVEPKALTVPLVNQYISLRERNLP